MLTGVCLRSEKGTAVLSKNGSGYKRRVLRTGIAVAAAIVITFTLIEIVMVIDTRDLWQYAQRVFSGDISREETDTKGEIWWIYGHPADPERVFDYENTLIRLFTWHDSNKGFISVFYDEKYYDRETGELKRSQKDLRVWFIEKIDGEWKLVGINPVKA